ncbi:MAG TPA: glycoside hydrolase family 2 TIM barrel-domain containing protein [Opitutus sp.]|nr:glycoside hydrolase family 2 TIM barrel-domain containing protein [Opitutus sp.]
MKPRALLLFATFVAGFLSVASGQPRVVRPFDDGWLFLAGDTPAAEDPMFDDANWRPLDVPHDWAIEGAPSANEPTGRGGGYRPSGVSWYRKRFTLPAEFSGRRVVIEFDGVMANSEVWVNGQHVGGRPSGYVSFTCDLTGRLSFGEENSNVLAVRTDTSAQPASRWYTGQGISRHTRLVVTDAVHIATWGVFVTTPKISDARATVRVRTTVSNRGDQPRDLAVHLAVLDPAGREVAAADTPTRAVAIGERADFTGELEVVKPQRWDLGHGLRYHARAEIRAGSAALDDAVVSFGIRETRFDADTGFWLNGKNVRLLGVCLHADGGAFGSAVPLDVWERRLTRLRELGVNAIRTAHNPPSPDFLDLCDRLGFLVMDELFDAWTVGKEHAEKGVNTWFTDWWRRDTRDTIRRDRNHPAIILYSAGNEIHDTPHAILAKNILAGIIGAIRVEDPTRPVTQALFRPNVSHDYTDGLADMLDVIGQNYRESELIAAHAQKPSRKVLGTENTHDPAVWVAMRDHPFIAGQFLWTGIDYLGEADWPRVIATSGLLDTTGAFRPRAWQRASYWAEKPLVHLLRLEPALAGTDPRRRHGYDLVSNWTPKNPSTPADAETTVEVYSNCDEVEVLLNGRSLGAKPKPADATARSWKTVYTPGTIRAIGRNGGKVVATDELRTAGAPVRLLASVDRARLAPGWDHVSCVTVTAVDANGVPCPWADDLVTFKISGPGIVAAVDNGDPQSHEPFQAGERHLFGGACVAFVKATASTGTISITATAGNLAGGSVAIEAAPTAP